MSKGKYLGTPKHPTIPVPVNEQTSLYYTVLALKTAFDTLQGTERKEEATILNDLLERILTRLTQLERRVTDLEP